MSFGFYFMIVLVKPPILNQRTKEYQPKCRTAHQEDEQQQLPKLCTAMTFLFLLGVLDFQSLTITKSGCITQKYA